LVSLSDQNERDVQPQNVTTTCTENLLIHSESLLSYTFPTKAFAASLAPSN